ncbi:MAG TPA: gephyrin-like molybdotransferase Glp [Acidobacteriaceae bacterium]
MLDRGFALLYEATVNDRVLDFEQALTEVLRHASGVSRPAKAPQPIALNNTLRRVLAEPVRAERDQPPFRRSTRDGYAVRSADIAAGRDLRVLGSVRAGDRWRGDALRDGEAVEIMTGAPVPDGSDAVLMVEHTLTGADELLRAAPGRLRAAPGRMLAAGENIVPRGAEARKGAEVIPAGRVVGAAEVALAAACGRSHLEVFERPKVAIIATGDELVELDAVPEPWQIRNSNGHALQALVDEEGGFGERLQIARDNREDLIERISRGTMADLLILSGGVSMGKYDFVEQVLLEFGAEFFFTGAQIKPGKPVVFGRVPKRIAVPREDEPPWTGAWTCFFGLPGNPVSTEVCFRLFVAPMLRALCGRTEIAPRFIEARLAADVNCGMRVTRFLPAIVESDWKQVSVRPVPWQGSGDLAANARANAFVVLPGGVQSFAAGESMRVLLR